MVVCMGGGAAGLEVISNTAKCTLLLGADVGHPRRAGTELFLTIHETVVPVTHCPVQGPLFLLHPALPLPDPKPLTTSQALC